ncbi:MAG: metallophosphoesterase, partial [Deltaproteobacteria bacterium]|nr:metallophosphoesterase [Deltaproteobacteria bacterium]
SQAAKFIKKVGFTLLRGEGITVAGLINIAGVDDHAAKHFGQASKVSEKDLLSKLPSEIYTLLLKHMPAVDKQALGHFDLQLSGHSHKGQFFPLNLITPYIYEFGTGLLDLPNHSRLYVSRGTGVWGPPIRILAPPEITVIDLVRA